jgi:hypothetical protein
MRQATELEGPGTDTIPSGKTATIAPQSNGTFVVMF